LSNDWQELIKFLGTTYSKSSPYHPQANAQTERFNLTVKNALKSQLDAANWSHKLPVVILALRTLYREEFDASAATMLYGINLRLLNQFYPTLLGATIRKLHCYAISKMWLLTNTSLHVFLQIKRCT